jgi:hypothetical protein
MFPMYFSLHSIIYLENLACTLIYGRRGYILDPHLYLGVEQLSLSLMWSKGFFFTLQQLNMKLL